MEFFKVLAVLSALSCGCIYGLENGLARTPPMGWLSWERFRCNVDCKNDPDNCISEQLYMKMADLMVSEGFKDAGYEYVNIDDCWMAMERDSKGRIQADPQRFPSGIKALANYMHTRGLKLGIYEDFGSKTCGGYPGSEYYMQSDANTFASWDVDMVKFDGCNSDPKDMPEGYNVMQFFLNQTGHPMVYSCEWPLYEYTSHSPMSSYDKIAKTCNMWRQYRDVTDSWESVTSIINYYGNNKGNFAQVAKPGAWNDPDMLVVGDFGLSYYQQQAQFGMWALWSSPLMMSLDLRSLHPQAKAILQNKNIIRINQDPLGNGAIQLYGVPNSISVWLKHLALPKTGSVAIGVLNQSNEGMPHVYGTSLADLGLNNTAGYNLTEAFEGKPMGVRKLTESFSFSINPTSLFILVAVPL